MKTILIAGGAGFIGINLCKRFLNEGNRIICVDNFYTGNKRNLEIFSSENFKLIEHDIITPFDIDEDIDEIYNLASPTSPFTYQSNPLQTIKTNVHGVFNLLDLAVKYDAKFLQSSTSEVYGEPLEHPQKESYWGNVNPNGIRSCYDESKRCAESICLNYHREYGINLKIARIFNTYGPYMDILDGRVVTNFMDGVSDRDYLLELMSDFSIIMMHLSRLSEELILWNSKEFDFVEIDDLYTTGSSIMPQKKNPDGAELIRGKTGRVYGNLMGLLTVMKGIPLAYNKDMQEDKEGFFDSVKTIEMCLQIMERMISTLKLKEENMKKAVHGGFLNATEVADYLVNKNVPFRDAHSIVGKIVIYCEDNNKAIEELTLEELKKFSEVIDSDIYSFIDYENILNKGIKKNLK